MRVGDPVTVKISNRIGEIHEVHPKRPKMYTVGKLIKVKLETEQKIDDKLLVSKNGDFSTYDLYPIHCFGERFRECRRKVRTLRYSEKFPLIGYCDKHYAWYKASEEGFKNRPEAELEAILNELFENRFTYAGNYPTVGAKWKPDFIDEENRIIIELFGDYWHSKERLGLTKEQHVRDRVDLFESRGYKTLIIWEKELKNWNGVKRKILNFVKKCDRA